jgi:hypothetical protein
MRNISFALTTAQFRERIKHVTRRAGWMFLTPGQRLEGCVKCMGLKPGERIQRLGPIVVVDVRREPLGRMLEEIEYGAAEAALEGFPGWTGSQFVELYLRHAGGSAAQMVTRIEFDYLDKRGRVVPRQIAPIVAR